MSKFDILINRVDDDIALEIWRNEKKITVYVSKQEIPSILFVDGDVIRDGTDLYSSLCWLVGRVEQ